MENKIKSLFRNELSESGISDSNISALEIKLSKLSINSDKLAEELTLYGKNLEKRYRKSFYESSIDILSQYYYPNTVSYLSNKLFSLDKGKVMNTLDVLRKEYFSLYVNFIDLSYKHSKGIDFIDNLFALDKLNESSVKHLMKEDIEEKRIKQLIPKEIFSNLY